MKKAILILGGNTDQLFMIKTAHEMNFETVVVDGNPKAIGLKEATYSKNIDFSKTQEVISYAQGLIDEGVNIRGVLTMGSDVPHLIAKIAKHFSWIGPSEYTASITTDKFLMKEKFESEDIAVPNFALVSSRKEILDNWLLWDCDKIVIKPVDAAGSRGVSIISNENEIESLFEHAKDNSKSKRVIIEEYIEGLQISTETIIYDNQYFHPGFANRVYDETHSFYPYIMENGGWQPSDIDEKKYDEICELLEKIAKAIELKRGVIKGDIVYSLKYKKPMVIEVASRLSGGDFSASLVPLSKGINYVKTAIQIALDEEVNFDELKAEKNNIVANRYFFVPPGELESIEGLEIFDSFDTIKKVEFNYEIGDKIPKIENHGQRVGVFIVCDKSYEAVQKTVDTIYSKIKFRVDGKTFSGHPEFYKV